MAALADRVDARRAFRHMEALTGLGPRVSGSEAEVAGANYLAEVLTESGLAVETPAFPIRRWLERAVSLSSDGISIQSTAVPFAGTLPPGEHRMGVACLDNAAPFDLLRADNLAGKAWLLVRDAYIHYPDTALVRSVAPHGPALLIFTASPGHIGGVPTVFYNFRDMDECPAPPCLVIAHADMHRLVTSGAREITVSLEAEVVPGVSRNVIGTLRGSERPDEIVVVCAHLDSAPTSPGASDNAGGSAIVAELARAAAVKGPFSRTVQFCVWGSHETGMHGSEEYIRRARASGLKVVAAINLDSIGQALGEDRLSILGGKSWNNFIDGLAGGTGIAPAIHRGPGYTDYTNFGAAGIPAVSIAQSSLAWNHTSGDSIDRCNPRGLVKPMAMAAALLSAIADAETDYRPDFPAGYAREVARFNARWGWSNFAPI